MKLYIYISYCVCLLLLSGCLDDKGSYDYKDLNSPTWLINIEEDFIKTNCYEGEIAKFCGHDYFRWKDDSIGHEANVRYEWKLNGDLLSTEADFDIATDSLIKLVGEDPFNENGIYGTFSVIDKTTDITFLVKTAIFIYSRYGEGNWLILSEDGDGSKLSFVKRRSGSNGVFYELTDNIFKKINGVDIPGKPIELAKAIEANVGAIGTTTVMTSQVAYVINNEDQVKVSELKDEFMDVTPENFDVVDRHDCDNFTFLATKNGEIFQRVRSENYLGGQFVSIPYVVDEKGYKVTKFGHSASNIATVPCYDEKNGRVLVITFDSEETFEPEYQKYRVSKISPVLKGVTGMDNIVPVWGMPEGSECLFLTSNAYIDISGGEAFTIVYNDASANTFIADFAVSYSNNTCLQNSDLEIIPFPGGNLNKESLFLTSASWSYGRPNDVVIYTKDREIRYLTREDNKDYALLSCDAKVTYIGYTTLYYEDRYSKLVVGLEDGSLLFYDISDKRSPKLLSKLKLNGKIVDAQEIGNVYNGGDAY